MGHKKWTIEELDYLEENYSNTCNIEISKKCNTSVEKTIRKANSIGLRKSEEFISELRDSTTTYETRNNKTYTNMLEFGNSLDTSEKHLRLSPIFDKYGFYEFKKMYKLHSA